MMPHFFAGEVKFPIRQSCGENTKIGLRRVRRQLGGEKAIYIEKKIAYAFYFIGSFGPFDAINESFAPNEPI